MNCCIGIISYLPNEIEKRQHRLRTLIHLIDKCNSLFNIPILIIAQNYKEVKLNFKNVFLFSYIDKLGIVKARKELRKIFLNSSFDNLIMLDDDCIILGTQGEEYLRQIEENPNKWYEWNKSRLKLFAISKYIFSKVDYENIIVENKDGFEDRLFYNHLIENFEKEHYIFNHYDLKEISKSSDDFYSTWHTYQDYKEMLKNTQNIIELEKKQKLK